MLRHAEGCKLQRARLKAPITVGALRPEPLSLLLVFSPHTQHVDILLVTVEMPHLLSLGLHVLRSNLSRICYNA